MRTQFITVILVSFVLATAASADAPFFEKQIRPILKVHCFHCHGEGEKKGGLDLRLTRLIVAGGSDGPAIIPGKPDESLLLKRVRDGEMPKSGKKLLPQEIELLEQWIAAGAKTVRPEPEDPADAVVTEEERAFWAYQPITAPAVPTVSTEARARSPIDAFIFSSLQKQGLAFSPEADRHTLVRRLYFDLLGLPPSPEELDQALSDTSADWYESLIDRLLASPHYGERWGRHWLDAAGFAESDGAGEADTPRPFAWKYRDYVVRSFNEDKPWDQFIQEQLAGDELTSAAPPYANPNAADCEKLIATGFLRMAPDGTQTANSPADRNQAVAETIKVVGSSLLGLTVGCAQCHDHKYDPIPQVDYYRFRAVFDPAFDLEHWRQPSQRRVSLYTDEQRTKAAEIETQAAALDSGIAAKEHDALEKVFEREIAKVAEEDREQVKAIRALPPEKRTADQKTLILRYPSADVRGSLDLYDPPRHKELQAERAKVAELRATKPPEDFLDLTTETPGQVPTSRLFARGDVDQPREPVAPAELTILSLNRGSREIAATQPSKPTTGRRLAYARLLTDGSHPLVARALVNRFWMHHFGRGIVATPGDFGSLGARPDHPELLDFLAADFMKNGWRLKRLHKLILTSTAYRQRSVRNASLDEIDPDNRLLARQGLRRLEAESIRDTLLSVSGRLNPRVYGPSVPVGENRDGQVIVGKQKRNENGEAIGTDDAGGDAFRRSIYIEVRRRTPLSILDTFDFPQMTPSCDLRRSSTVAPQALSFLNDALIIEQATALAARLRREAPGNAATQVRQAYRLLYAAEPTNEELESALSFLAVQEKTFAQAASSNPPAADAAAKPADDPGAHALASLCQAFIGANRFIYID